MLRNTKFDNIVDEEEEIEKKLKQADLERIKTEAEAVRKQREEDDDDDSDSDSELSPLFWTKPPSMRKKASPEALELEKTFNSMIYDDKPPMQLAIEAKDRGNNALQQGFHDVARDAYKEGLKFAHQAWTPENDASQLIATLLANRAQVELKVKNYRAAIKDCKASLKLVSEGSIANKTRFRAAKACLAINKPNEALEAFLNNVVEDEPNTQLVTGDADATTPQPKDKTAEELRMLRAVKRECLVLEEKLNKLEVERRRRFSQAENIELKWRQVLQEHGVKVGPLTMDLQQYTGGSETVGGPGPKPTIHSDGSWSWPVLFMYPEYGQSDFVQEFKETTKLGDMLGEMFQVPPPWDENLKYQQVGDLSLYVREKQVRAFDLNQPFAVQTSLVDQEIYEQTKWFKLAFNLTLEDVLKHKSVVVPGIPTFIVLSHKSKQYEKTFLDAVQRVDGPVRKM